MADKPLLPSYDDWKKQTGKQTPEYAWDYENYNKNTVSMPKVNNIQPNMTDFSARKALNNKSMTEGIDNTPISINSKGAVTKVDYDNYVPDYGRKVNNKPNTQPSNNHIITDLAASVLQGLGKGAIADSLRAMGRVAENNDSQFNQANNMARTAIGRKPMEDKSVGGTVFNKGSEAVGKIADKFDRQSPDNSTLYNQTLSAASSLGQMLGDVGISAASGIPVPFLMGIQSGQETYDEAKKQGASELEASIKSTVGGLIEGGSEYIGGGNAMKKIIKGQWKELLTKESEDVAEEAMKKTFGAEAWKFIKKEVLGEAAQEAGTEVAHEVADASINAAYGRGFDNDPNTTMKDNLANIAWSAYGGGLLGAVGGGVTEGVKRFVNVDGIGQAEVIGNTNNGVIIKDIDGNTAEINNAFLRNAEVQEVPTEVAKPSNEATPDTANVPQTSLERIGDTSLSDDERLNLAVKENEALKSDHESGKIDSKTYTEKIAEVERQLYNEDASKASPQPLQATETKQSVSMPKPKSKNITEALLNEDGQATFNKIKADMRNKGIDANFEVIKGGTAFHKDIQKITKGLGVNVVFYKGDKVPNGFVSNSVKNTIFIHSSGDKNDMVATAGHEFLHHFKKTYTNEYKELLNFAKTYFSEEARAKYLDTYSNVPELQASLANDENSLLEEMLADEMGNNFMSKDFWQRVYDHSKELFEKLVEAAQRIVKNFASEDKYETFVAKETAETLSKKFEEAIAHVRKSVAEGKVDTEARILDENGLMLSENKDSIAPVDYSIRTWTSEAKKKIIELAEKNKIADMDKTLDYLKAIDNVAAYIENHPEIDYEASNEYKALKNNSDPHYKESLDFSTLCKKRHILQGTIEEIQSKLGRGLTQDEWLDVRKTLDKLGIEVSCGACYVDTRRMEMGLRANQYIENNIKKKQWYSHIKNKQNVSYPEELPPTEWFFTQEGLDKMKAQYPDIYTDFNSKTGARGIKAPESRTEYRGEILNLSDSRVNALNSKAGLRWQSWSDFELPHLIDGMQAIADMYAKGLKGHAYTKVENFIKAFADTGMMINMSLIPKGRGLDADGNLLFDSKEGMEFEVTKKYRDMYHNNVGTITIGVNDDFIRAAMKSEYVDYVIPYHASGLSLAKRTSLGIGMEEWKDYTNSQNPKARTKEAKANAKNLPDIYDLWDYNKSPIENAEAYVNEIDKMGFDAPFSQFIERGEDGHLVDNGYWKTLIDHRMVNKYGENIVQEPVKPEFNEETLNTMLKEYKGEHNNKQYHSPTVDKLVEQFSKRTRSITNSKLTMKDATKDNTKFSVREKDKQVIEFNRKPWQYSLEEYKEKVKEYSNLEIPIEKIAITNDVEPRKIKKYKSMNTTSDAPPIIAYPQIITEDDIGTQYYNGDSLIHELTNEDIGKIFYFVEDGNHRVIAAKESGKNVITVNASGFNGEYENVEKKYTRLIEKHQASKLFEATRKNIESNKVKEKDNESVKESIRKKERSHHLQYEQGIATDSEVMKRFSEDAKNYEPISIKETWDRMSNYVQNNYEQALEEVRNMNNFASADDVAKAEAVLMFTQNIAQQFDESGLSVRSDRQYNLAASIAEKINAHFTKAGQTVVMGKLWKMLSPQGVVKMAEKMIEKETDPKKKEQIKADAEAVLEDIKKLNQEGIEKVKEFLKIQSTPTIEETEKAREESKFNELDERTQEISEIFDTIEARSAKKIAKTVTDSLKDILSGLDIGGIKFMARGLELNPNESLGQKLARITEEHYSKPLSERGNLSDKLVKELGINRESADIIAKRVNDKMKEVTKKDKLKALGKAEEKTPSMPKPNKDTEEVSPEDLLADKVRNHMKEPVEQEVDAIKDMVNTLYEVAKKTLPEKAMKNARNPMEFITQAIENAEEYKEVWNKAKEIVAEQYADNPDVLNALGNYFDDMLDKPFSDKQLSKAARKELKDLQLSYNDLAIKKDSDIKSVIDKIVDRLEDYDVSKDTVNEVKHYLENEITSETNTQRTKIIDNMFKDKIKGEEKPLHQVMAELYNLGVLDRQEYRTKLNERVSKLIKKALKQNNIDLNQLITKQANLQFEVGQDMREYLIDNGFNNNDASLLGDYIEQVYNMVTGEAKRKYLEKTFKPRGKSKVEIKSWIDKFIEMSNAGGLSTEDITPLVAAKYNVKVMSPEIQRTLIAIAEKIQSLEKGTDEYNIAVNGLNDYMNSIRKHDVWEHINTIENLFMLSGTKSAVRNNIGNLGRLLSYDVEEFGKALLDMGKAALSKDHKRSVMMPQIGQQLKGLKEGFLKELSDIKNDVDSRAVEDSREFGKYIKYKNPFMKTFQAYVKFLMTDRPFNQAMINDVISRAKKLAEKNNVEFDAVEAKQIAEETASKIFFNGDDKVVNAMLKIRREMNFGKEWGLGTVLFKFVKVPYNISKFAIEREWHLASLKILYRAISTGYGAFKKTDVGYMKDNKFDTKEFLSDVTKGLNGAFIMYIGTMLFNLGLIHVRPDDDDKDKKLLGLEKLLGTNKYQLNVSAARRFFTEGMKKQDIQEGDSLATLDWFTPLSILMIAGIKAEMLETEKDANMEDKKAMNWLLEKVSALATGVGEQVDTVLELPMLQSLRKLKYAETTSDKIMTILKDIPTRFVPAPVKYAKDLSDANVRETYADNEWDSSKNLFKAKLPVASKKLEPKLNILGEEIKNNNSLLNVALNPAISTKYTNDPEALKMQEVYKKFGIKDQIPSAIETKWTITKKNYPRLDTEEKTIVLSPSEYTYFQQEYGKKVREDLKAMTVYTDKDQMVKEASRINTLYSKAKSKIKDEILEKRGIK